VARFYDELAADYHLIYPDWDASLRRQGAALTRLIGRTGADVLDCACGIGTQALGLALHGQHVSGTDLSRAAVARAGREAAHRGLRLRLAVADMRRQPFRGGRFDVVVCADNSLSHLLTEPDVAAALAEMRRVLRPGGQLLVSIRDYDRLRAERPTSAPPQVHRAADGQRSVTVQLWHWHDDAERYDMEHFQVLPAGDGWRVNVRTAAHWAIDRDRLTRLATGAGFVDPAWLPPADTGFFQPVLTARAAG
jgi:SAM-dependent methyltransferase